MNVLLLSANRKPEQVLCGRTRGREKGQEAQLGFGRLDYHSPKRQGDVTCCALGPPDSLLPLKGDA